MKLGAFSVSLSVKDIHQSYAFYKNLGFNLFHGDIDQGWLMLKNGKHRIGLFQGMFEGNMLTFNPGWNQNAEPLNKFKDIREIQRELQDKSVPISEPIEADSEGPANFTVQDPDGNVILLDQHV